MEYLQSSSTKAAIEKIQHNLHGNKLTKMLQQTLPVSKEFWVITPDHPMAQAWNSICFLISCYYSLTIPLLICFHMSSALMMFVTLDIICVIISVIDMYVRLRFMALIQDGRLISDPLEFSHHYWTKSFSYDFISSLPLALVVYALTRKTGVYSFLRLLQFMKLVNMETLFNTFLDAMECWTKVRILPDVVRVVKTVSIVWYIGHVVACTLCYLGLDALRNNYESWIEINGWESESNGQIYLQAYTWTMYTIVTVSRPSNLRCTLIMANVKVGYGYISLASTTERVFAIIVMVIGAGLCNASVDAVLSSIISNKDRLSSHTRLVFCLCSS
jgi:hypothetical protein